MSGFFAGILVLTSGLPSVQSAVSFRTDVMPVISKAGCNAGACHGNANGKAGFKLSLRGDSPELDFQALTHDQVGRRINLVAPEESLLLMKPAGLLAHEGGQRFKKDSPQYATLRAWITEGAQDDGSSAPVLTQLNVNPTDQVLLEPTNRITISAEAVFSDGRRRNVSDMAVYEAANAIAKVSPEGVVEADGFGETTVLVRYLGKQAAVRLAFVPVRPEYRWSKPRPRNFVDEQIFAKLRRLRMNPSPLCDDEVFLRRAYLDLLGILPTADEARDFVSDKKKDKRAKKIDVLLQRGEFADFWALKWSDLLRNEERVLDRKGVENFHRWVRQSIFEGKPLDQFARELISARGSTYDNPAANYYRANREPAARAEAAAQVFLGTRLQCAQCHNHPFDRWSQDDYFDWTDLFSRVQYKIVENRRRDSNDQHEFKGEQIVYMARKGSVKNPRTGQPAKPRFLGSTKPLPEDGADYLSDLGGWLTSTNNPFFARTQANRIWFHLMGRGLVDPIDDFRATNPASHPELLEALTRELVARKFDMRALIRVIMNSRAYQTSSEPNETNRDDETNYAHALVRRLTAEQILDCESEVTGVPVKFAGYPTGVRASQLPGALAERKRDSKGGEVDHFLETFGKPARLLTSECERSCEPTMSQAFQMISGPSLNALLIDPNNRLTKLLEGGRSPASVVEELYWTALTRAPSAAELNKATALIEKARDRRAALEDLTWSLINAKEFILRR